MESARQICGWAAVLAEIALAQRSKANQKLREQIAANYRKHLSVTPLEGFEKRIENLKDFVKLPRYSQQKAWDRKLLLSAYHFLIEWKHLIPNEASRVARALWLLMRGESVTDSTIRRWLRRERARGGPDFAPIKAYADGKSVPHRRRVALSTAPKDK